MEDDDDAPAGLQLHATPAKIKVKLWLSFGFNKHKLTTALQRLIWR